jgi:hypothetical protein
MENHYVALDGMVSQEVVSDINVFGSRMLTRVVGNLDGTHCHIGEGHGSKCNHNPLEFVASKEVVHNNYRLQHTPVWLWIG